MVEIPLFAKESFSLSKNFFQEISDLIRFFNLQHPAEMLPKTTEQLKKIYQQGLSVVAVDSKNEKVMGHVALYPLIDTEIDGKVLKLAELGSWIVAPNYRHYRLNGLTIGEAIAQELISKFPSLPIIATVKRINSFQGLLRIGFESLNFAHLPFIAPLTCVCQNSSEHYGHQCSYRRREGYGIENGKLNLAFEIINDNEPPSIPCTLLGYNLHALAELNQYLNHLITSNEPSSANPENLSEIFKATRKFFGNYDIFIT